MGSNGNSICQEREEVIMNKIIAYIVFGIVLGIWGLVLKRKGIKEGNNARTLFNIMITLFAVLILFEICYWLLDTEHSFFPDMRGMKL